jgi:hypothetical protein
VNATVRVQGVREVQKAFRGVDRSLAAEFGQDLQKAAEPVAQAARAKEKWQGASINTIRTRRRGVNIYVEQSARKVTGLRGDYGALQMRQALEPALDENSGKVFSEVASVLDKYANREGF